MNKREYFSRLFFPKMKHCRKKTHVTNKLINCAQNKLINCSENVVSRLLRNSKWLVVWKAVQMVVAWIATQHRPDSIETLHPLVHDKNCAGKTNYELNKMCLISCDSFSLLLDYNKNKNYSFKWIFKPRTTC